MSAKKNITNNYDRDRSSIELAELGNKAIAIFKKNNAELFGDLLKTYKGRSVNLVIIGEGQVVVTSNGRSAKVSPGRSEEPIANSAIRPEALMAILDEEISPAQAFHRGDLIARGNINNLQDAYRTYKKSAHLINQSKQSEELKSAFCKICGL